MTDRKSKTPAERALEALGPKLRGFAKAAKNATTAQDAARAAQVAAQEAAERLSYAVANPDLPERDDNDEVDQAKCLLEGWYGVTEGEGADDPEAPEADTLTPKVVQDLLLLVEAEFPNDLPDFPTIESWGPITQRKVAEWASAVHLAASDIEDVVVAVPDRPAVLG